MGKRRRGLQREGTCVYCGAVGPITKDHVIPRSLFKDRDRLMITVPSCGPCNRKKATGEPHLRLYVNSHHGGSQHPDAIWHIEQLVARSPVSRDMMERMLLEA